MQQLKELKDTGFPITSTTNKLAGKVIKGKSEVVEMATVQKHRDSTKHLNVKLHHFWDYVTFDEVTILPIETPDQASDFLTKDVN